MRKVPQDNATDYHYHSQRGVKGFGYVGKKRKTAKKDQARLDEATTLPAKRLRGTVRPYLQQVLVCTDDKSKACRKSGPAVLKAFQATIKARRLHREVLVTAINHVGGCGLGPNVIVYPDGVWYGLVEVEDVEEIVERHLIGGEAVTRLIRGTRANSPCGGCALLSTPLERETERLAA